MELETDRLQYKRRSEVNTSAIHMYPYRVVSLQLIYSALDRLMWMRWRSVQGDQTSQSISYVLGMEDRARQTRRPPISLECAFARGAEFCLGAKRVDGESGSSASTLTSPSVSRYLVHNRKTLSDVAKLLGNHLQSVYSVNTRPFLRYASLYAADSDLRWVRATAKRSINRNAPSRC